MIVFFTHWFFMTIITAGHCLYVQPTQDAKADFEKQCDILIDWKNRKIKPEALFNLNGAYTKNELNAAKRELMKVFHPDKHPDSNTKATAAFQILEAASDYLEMKLSGSLELRSNIFYQQGSEKKQPQSQETKEEKPLEKEYTYFDGIEKWSLFTIDNYCEEDLNEEMKRLADVHGGESLQEAYEKMLQNLLNSGLSGQLFDRLMRSYFRFFSMALHLHPELFSITTSINNEAYDLLGLLLLKGGSKEVCIRISSLISEHFLFLNRSHKDYMSIAMENNRMDFIGFAMRRYGLQAFPDLKLNKKIWHLVAKQVLESPEKINESDAHLLVAMLEIHPDLFSTRFPINNEVYDLLGLLLLKEAPSYLIVKLNKVLKGTLNATISWSLTAKRVIESPGEISESNADMLIAMLETCPDLFSTTFSIQNEVYDLLGLFLLKGAPESRFAKLYSTLKGRILFGDRSHKDYMILAMENNRSHFIEFAIKTYGSKALHESRLDEDLCRFIKQNRQLLYMLISVWKYRPKANTDLGHIIREATDYPLVDACHLGDYVNYQKLLGRILDNGEKDILFLCIRACRSRGIIKQGTPISSLIPSDLLSFLKKPHARSVLQSLRENGAIFDIPSLSNSELIELVNLKLISSLDLRSVWKTTPAIWQNKQLLELALEYEGDSFIYWLNNASILDNTEIGSWSPLVAQALEKQRYELVYSFDPQILPSLIKLFKKVCQAIASDPNPIEAGHAHFELLAQYVHFVISTKNEYLLDEPIEQALNIPHVLDMQSFTPVQLLVILKHSQAMELIADSMRRHWDARIHVDVATSLEVKQENISTLTDLAKIVGFSEFTKLHQLHAARNLLRIIQAEKEPFIQFFGLRKSSKINALQALITYNQRGTLIPEEYFSTLSDINLRGVVALHPVKYDAIQTSSFKYFSSLD